MTYLDETNVDAVYDAAEDANNQEVWVGLKVDDDGKYQVIIDFLFHFYIRFFLVSQDILADDYALQYAFPLFLVGKITDCTRDC